MQLVIDCQAELLPRASDLQSGDGELILGLILGTKKLCRLDMSNCLMFHQKKKRVEEFVAIV